MDRFIFDLQAIIVSYLDINFDINILKLCDKNKQNYILKIWENFPTHYKLIFNTFNNYNEITSIFDENIGYITINNELHNISSDNIIDNISYDWNSTTPIIFWNDNIFYSLNNKALWIEPDEYDDYKNKKRIYYGNLITNKQIIDKLKYNKTLPPNFNVNDVRSNGLVYPQSISSYSKYKYKDKENGIQDHDNICMCVYPILKNDYEIELYVSDADHG